MITAILPASSTATSSFGFRSVSSSCILVTASPAMRSCSRPLSYRLRTSLISCRFLARSVWKTWISSRYAVGVTYTSRRSDDWNLAASMRTDSWKLLHISTTDCRLCFSISTSARKVDATASSASAGHGRNQSIVQQLTRDGNMRKRVRKASPMGDMARHVWIIARQRLTKYAKCVVGVPSPSSPSLRAASRTLSAISAFSLFSKRLGTSPALSRPLMSSRYASCLIWVSANKKTIAMPARLSTFLMSSRQSTSE